MGVLSVIWETNLSLFHYLNALGQSPTISMVVVTTYKNSVLRFLVLTAPYIYFWFRKERDWKLICDLGIGLASVALAIFVARVGAKLLPFELRPMYDVASGFQQMAVRTDPDMEAWSSFPSDTAAVCVALTTALAWVDRKTAAALFCVALVLFCLTRVIMGIHYPLDIFCGGCVGFISVCVLHAIPLRRMEALASLVFRFPEPIIYPLIILYLAQAAQMFNGLRSLKGLASLISN